MTRSRSRIRSFLIVPTETYARFTDNRNFFSNDRETAETFKSEFNCARLQRLYRVYERRRDLLFAKYHSGRLNILLASYIIRTPWIGLGRGT